MIETHQIDIINSVLLKYSLQKVGLFGSRVRGNEYEKSDLDILVSFKNDGKGPYSILELLDVEKIADKLGFPVKIRMKKTLKTNVSNIAP